MSAEGGPMSTVQAIRPITGDFWQEFAIQYGWIKYAQNLGLFILATEKTKQLAQEVLSYASIKKDEIEQEALELIFAIPDYIKYLNWALYSCIQLPDRRIGYSHLRQVTIYPTTSLEIGVICRGFTEPLPQDWYFLLKSTSHEITYPCVHALHGIFSALLETQKVKIPPDFFTGDEVLIGD